MKHNRSDYSCIQPWPVKRSHIAKIAGVTGEIGSDIGEDEVNPIIPDDEPVFLIRAQDAVAPEVVDYWASRAQYAGTSVEVVNAAYDWANEMRTWQNEHGNKVPDAPEGAYDS